MYMYMLQYSRLFCNMDEKIITSSSQLPAHLSWGGGHGLLLADLRFPIVKLSAFYMRTQSRVHF